MDYVCVPIRMISLHAQTPTREYINRIDKKGKREKENKQMLIIGRLYHQVLYLLCTHTHQAAESEYNIPHDTMMIALYLPIFLCIHHAGISCLFFNNHNFSLVSHLLRYKLKYIFFHLFSLCFGCIKNKRSDNSFHEMDGWMNDVDFFIQS